MRFGTWKELRWPEFAYGGVAPVGTIRLQLPNQPIWRRYLLLLVPDPPVEDQGYLYLEPGAYQLTVCMLPAQRSSRVAVVGSLGELRGGSEVLTGGLGQTWANSRVRGARPPIHDEIK